MHDWNVKFDREAQVSEPLYHTPDADGLNIKSTSTLTGSVHTTVNALREAIAVQRMLERDAIICNRVRTIINRNRNRRLQILITKPIIKNKIMRTKWKSRNTR
jgi:hypothetical protein